MLRVFGIDKLKKRLKAETKRWTEATAAAQLKMGIDLLTQARSLVPVQTGRLRDSAFARVVRGRRGVYVKAGFAARHAGAIHKGMAKRAAGLVRFRLRNGEPRFLAKALRAIRAGYAKRMKALARIYHANNITTSLISNPYQTKADQWREFQRAVRTEMRRQRRAETKKWAGFNREVRRQMNAAKGV
jgi:hypothetical protein